ncbi:MAG: hypothetical protein QOK14_1429 [Frankiaceae bacterium]|nr:hypothetical protein [Frankiaceae bacterium]
MGDSPQARPDRPTVTVCRGCCCGDPGEPSAGGAAGRLARLRDELADTARVRVTDCLDVCDMADVLIVSPSAAGRIRGGRPVWLGRVLDDGAISDVIAWARAGGPGIGEQPVTVELYEFSPSRRIREAGERS